MFGDGGEAGLISGMPGVLLMQGLFVLMVCAGISLRFAWALRLDRPWMSARHALSALLALLAVGGGAWFALTLGRAFEVSSFTGALGVMVVMAGTPAFFALALSGAVLSLVMLGLRVAPDSVRGPWRVVMLLSLSAVGLTLIA